MSLKQTGKGFLTSIMAITLASHSVFAFVHSAFADLGQQRTINKTVSFTGEVAPKCAVISSSTQGTYTSSTENRTISLIATMRVSYDCNSDTVSVTVSGQNTTYNSSNTPSKATDMGYTPITHQWSWGKGATPTTDFADGNTILSSSETTNAAGDIDISIGSTWTGDAEELLATTYSASLELTVTPK